MSLRDWFGDLFWVVQRTRAPAFAASVTGAPPSTVRGFAAELAKAGVHERKEVLLYLVTRALRPQHVVETGVWYGWSSRAILAALHVNGSGRLTSIDLPTLTAGRLNADGTFDRARVDAISDTGREVPAYLKDRWELRLVSSPEESTAALEQSAALGIDMFLHDSDHSYENMTREFRIAWAGLGPRGVLYSDDVDWNAAFTDFARSVNRARRTFRLYPYTHSHVGALTK